MTSDAKSVLSVIINADLSINMTMYGPDKGVISTKNIAYILKWSKYRTKKAIAELKEMGYIKRESVGCPAIVSCGEYQELISESRPPINGFGLTKVGYESSTYKEAFRAWEKSLEEWANE